MNLHEEFAEDLSLYALGALSDEERATVEKHLQGCAACRREVEELRGDLALLALSVSGPKPPSRCRERLMAEIAKEPRGRSVRPRKRSVWWNALELVAAAAAIVIIVQLARHNNDLGQRLASLQTRSTDEQRRLQQANELLTALTSAEAKHFTLVASKTAPQPQGKAIYVRRTGTLVFLASNMPAIPPQKTYELWLIPTTGAPIPAGLFKPNARGSAEVIKPPLPVGVEAKTFAITIEPQSGSSAPTSQPIMVGSGG